MSDLIDRLRDRAYCGKGVDRLCEEAADELGRLRIALDCYCRSSAAAAAEINGLNAQVKKLEEQCGEHRAQQASLKSRLAELEHLTERLQGEFKERVARQ